jgi:IS1 family transposase
MLPGSTTTHKNRIYKATKNHAYERQVKAEQHTVGKENTQKIESKHINVRTRIKR